MPTYTLTRTLDEVRRLVLRKLRVVAPGRAPSAAHAAVVDEAIDLRLKELHALGVLWWQVSPATTNLALVAATATVSLSAVTDFLFPVSVALRVGTEDIPLEIISHRQYQAIPGKTESGEPECLMISGGTAYFWPVPAQNYTGKLTYQAIAADTVAPTQPDVPIAMMRSFVTLVAADCADDFSVPEQRVQRLMGEAQLASRTLRMLNTERVESTVVEMTSF